MTSLCCLLQAQVSAAAWRQVPAAAAQAPAGCFSGAGRNAGNGWCTGVPACMCTDTMVL